MAMSVLLLLISVKWDLNTNTNNLFYIAKQIYTKAHMEETNM